MRYVLCRPIGGLIDSFMEIQKCYIYCQKFNRILLIDTLSKDHYENNNCFNFYDFFEFYTNELTIITDAYKIKEILNNKDNDKYTVFPNYINLSELQSFTFQKPIKFNLDIDYEQNILLYMSWSDNTNPNFNFNLAVNLFNKIKIKKKLLDDFLIKYTKIPKPYNCIHIRNTDLSINLKRFLRKNKELINNSNSLYISTDSFSTINLLKQKKIKFYNFSNLNTDSKNLHSSKLISGEEKIKDAISDLFLISFSKKYIKSIGYFSEFGDYLNKNKELVIKCINSKNNDYCINYNGMIYDKQSLNLKK